MFFTATGTIWGYTHTAATDGIAALVGSGRTAFRHSAATLPGVSMPSSVVKSMHEMARLMAARFDVVLMDRVVKVLARASSPTSSTGVTRSATPLRDRGAKTAAAAGVSTSVLTPSSLPAPGGGATISLRG